MSLDNLNCSEAALIVRAFGSLAQWWLHGEVLKRAAHLQPAFYRYLERPKLPTSKGSCWAILACNQFLPLLRPAMLLPLCWVQNAPHLEERLPSPLKSLAKRVVQQLEATSWNLSLHSECDLASIDMSQLTTELSWDSAWASLAGGLFLANKEIQPSSKIWASIAYDPTFGIGRIDEVATKLNLAVEYGVERFYLPEVNREDSLSSKTTQFIPGNSNKSQLIDFLLEPYIQAMGIEPYHSSFEIRKAFYQTAERDRAESFYLKSLVTELAANCARVLTVQEPHFKPTHLVSVIGENPSNTALACELIRQLSPDASVNILLFRTKDTAIQKVLNQLVEKYPNLICQTICSNNRHQEIDLFKDSLLKMFPDVRPEQIAFDLTPGFKYLNLAIMEAAPVGSWFLYCRHDRSTQGKPQLGTERYDCWQKK